MPASSTYWTPSLPEIGRLAFVLEARIAGDNKELGEARKLRDDVLGNAITEIVFLLVATEVCEGHDGNRGLVWQREGGSCLRTSCGSLFGLNAIDMHKLRNVLQLL